MRSELRQNPDNGPCRCHSRDWATLRILPLTLQTTLHTRVIPLIIRPYSSGSFQTLLLVFPQQGLRLSGFGDRANNGKWFVVLGSGPTGPIQTVDHQFIGHSDQNLKFFILDLKGASSGTWTLNTNYWVKDSGIQNAFAGSMINTTIDVDMDYQDDACISWICEKDGDEPKLYLDRWRRRKDLYHGEHQFSQLGLDARLSTGSGR